MLKNATAGKFNCKWCGPTAVSSITGFDASSIAEAICDYRKTKSSNRVSEPTKLSATWFDELKEFLGNNGFPLTKHIKTKNNGKLVWHNNDFTGGHYEMTNGHPTFTQWIKTLGSGKYIVRVGGTNMGHFLAVSKQGNQIFICDSAATRGQVILLGKGFKYSRSRVAGYLEVQ